MKGRGIKPFDYAQGKKMRDGIADSPACNLFEAEPNVVKFGERYV